MSGQSMADVLAGHWSRSTFTNHRPNVDKCDGCGAVIYTWGDDPIPGGIEPLANHQAAALSAAGFGLVQEAKAGAWDEGCEEATEHYAAHAHDPNINGPADPPTNPYRKDQP